MKPCFSLISAILPSASSFIQLYVNELLGSIHLILNNSQSTEYVITKNVIVKNGTYLRLQEKCTKFHRPLKFTQREQEIKKKSPRTCKLITENPVS